MRKRKSRNYEPREVEHKEHEGNLNHFRLDMGLTINEVCEVLDILPGCYCGFNNGMRAPINPRTGKISPIAEKLAQFFNAEYHELWPAYFCPLHETIENKAEKITERTISQFTLSEFTFDDVENRQLLKIICSCVDELTDKDIDMDNEDKRLAHWHLRYKEIIKLLYVDGYTQADIADHYDISRERARQLVCQIHRRIKFLVKQKFTMFDKDCFFKTGHI